MLKKLIFFVLFSLSTTVFSQEWFQSKTHTKALFSVKKLGIKVVGNFKDAEVHTNFHRDDLEHSYVNVKIRVKSISMGNKNRDKKVLNECYFYEQQHKFIQFTSSKIEQKDNGEFFISGVLTIKGISKKVRVPFEVVEHGEKIILKSNFKINRKDFKLGDDEFGLSKSAKIVVKFIGTT